MLVPDRIIGLSSPPAVATDSPPGHIDVAGAAEGTTGATQAHGGTPIARHNHQQAQGWIVAPEPRRRWWRAVSEGRRVRLSAQIPDAVTDFET